MSRLFEKFIIEGTNLILGKCTYHRQLVTNRDNVRGGGVYYFNSETNSYTLGGKSHEFGYAELDNIRECVRSGNVYGDKRLRRNLSSSKFYYNTQVEIIPLN